VVQKDEIHLGGIPPGRNHLSSVSNNTLLYALYRMGYKSRMTGHGFLLCGSNYSERETKVPLLLIKSKIFNHPLARPYKIIGTFITHRTTGSWSTDAAQAVVSKYEVGGIVDQLNAWRVTQVGTLFDAVVHQRQGPTGTILSAVPPAANFDKWASPGSAVPSAGVLTNDGLHPLSAPANIMGGNLRPTLEAM
jgi:hypothetical protein